MLLNGLGANTSCLTQQPLGHQAVGRGQVQWLLALRVPDGLTGAVVQQDGHQLGVGKTSGDVQRRLTGHTVVHTGA